MTAEVIVMNKESVALAADSAVTNGSKIYESANKLFTLRKDYPVGVMISNAAYFMGIPWETMIKVHRQEKLGDRPKSTIPEYTAQFLEFVQENRFCNDRVQASQISQIAQAALQEPARVSKEAIDRKFTLDRACTIEEANGLAYAELESFRGFVRAHEDYPFENVTEDVIRGRFEDLITEAVRSLFSAYGIGLNAQTLELAVDCAILVILKKMPSTAHSTISIVGFGSDELFPAYQLMTIDGVICGELKVFERVDKSIDRYGQNVVIQPMGQSDMVARFMKGIDGALYNSVVDYFRGFCEQAGMDPDQVTQAVSDFESSLSSHQQEFFVDPIIRTVQHLPRTDLANMAESLVSLTSIKRRVSEERDTVAGPIDVAVISKGDGFIWMKRKHYFSPDLNQHHRTLYFKGDDYE